MVKSMYCTTSLCVNLKGMRSEFFDSNIGVKQGDALSPQLFNLFINDLPDYVGCDDFTPLLSGKKVNCLMYADDLVLIYTSPVGLQTAMNRLPQKLQRMVPNGKYLKI